ncbi:hypothetical protein GCM10022224_069060 [Nonomuraea antimicrobica]|uniref:Uncharacterized protein n=1 Tax=Nonomuraea antimicrobica TaxID=561173 RepID=A0ABP7CNX8_9ACTN
MIFCMTGPFIGVVVVRHPGVERAGRGSTRIDPDSGKFFPADSAQPRTAPIAVMIGMDRPVVTSTAPRARRLPVSYVTAYT